MVNNLARLGTELEELLDECRLIMQNTGISVEENPLYEARYPELVYQIQQFEDQLLQCQRERFDGITLKTCQVLRVGP